MIDEALLAVQDAREIDVERASAVSTRSDAIAVQAEQEGRRHRQGRIAGVARGGIVDIDRIGLADGLGEEAQAAASRQSTVPRGSSRPIRLLSIMIESPKTVSLSRVAVQRHDAGAAEAEIVLQRESRAVDLACLGRAAQLLRQLVALRQAGGAERMTLRQQAARWVGHDLAAIGVVAVVDELLGAALRAKPERLVGEQFVVREAVVQFDHVDVLRDRRRPPRRPAARLPAPCRSRPPGSVERASKVDRACRWSWPAPGSARRVRRPCLPGEVLRDR